MDILSLQGQMADILKPKRYLHVLGVSYTCASLAMRYQVDLTKAQIAGLLHDCAKHLSGETLLMECITYGLPISMIEEKNPYLLHGKLGAYYAKEKYGVEDEEILSSIIYHTTGKPNMTILEKIVFVADYIEPSRQKDRVRGLDEVREHAFENLDRTVYEVARNTLAYLKECGGDIDSTTVDTYNYYKKYAV